MAVTRSDHLFVCTMNIEQILMKFGGDVGDGPRRK